MASNPHARVTRKAAGPTDGFAWEPYIRRFEAGEWRAPIFRDMVARDMATRGPAPVVLDIGCGRGFDDSPEMQTSLAAEAGRYIGVEPDDAVAAPPVCHEFHATLLEDAPIAPGSVDVAFAMFVIEHLDQPQRFFTAVHAALKPGGVFWGATIDRRSPFAYASSAMKVIGIKDRYLDRMFGRREERHLNYPTHYAANTPKRLTQLAGGFSSCEVASLHCVGIIDKVLPRAAHPIAHALDRATLKYDWPGTNLMVRLVK
jgi:SAM-dependent methyltransferase